MGKKQIREETGLDGKTQCRGMSQEDLEEEDIRDRRHWLRHMRGTQGITRAKTTRGTGDTHLTAGVLVSTAAAQDTQRPIQDLFIRTLYQFQGLWY